MEKEFVGLNALIENSKQIWKEHTRKREKLENQKHIIEEKLEKLWKVNKSDIKLIYTPLAKAICEKMNLKFYEFYGPFGLNQETSIYFSNYSTKKTKSNKIGICAPIAICEVDTYSLDLVRNDDTVDYWTGEQTNEFAKGTLGYYNGFNKVREPLPDSLDEIVKLLRYSKGKEK